MRANRRGHVLIYVSIAMAAFVGFVSLAVDMAHVWLVKSELQSAADAASRAACQALPNGATAAQNAAVAAAAANNVDGSPLVLNPSTDIVFGTWNPTNRKFTPLSGSAISGANAVEVNPAHTRANNNPVNLSFAGVIGMNTFDVKASAIACRGGTDGAYSLIGLNGITFTGAGFTDSYNSSQGAYSPGSARHRGSIASNGNILLQGSARVDGDVRCGVGKTTTFQNAAVATGLVAPLGATMSYPSAHLPSFYLPLGDINMSSGTTYMPGGVYYIANLTLSGSATVNWMGPTVLYIGYSYNVSGSAAINTYQNLPKNRVLNFLPTCKTASWTGTNQNVGEMYAPDTDFTIGGTVDLYGRVVAKSLNVNNDGGLHYDEALAPPGGTNSVPSISSVR